MADDLKTRITEAAAEPARARDQAVEVQERSLGELIEADKHLRRTNVATKPFGAIFRAKIRPGRAGGLE